MANTGILYRRNVKSFFEKDSNKPIEGEIVYATDTDEYGALDKDGSITWRPHEGAVVSVNSRQGEIHLDKTDVGLSNVDNTSDNDKPLSSAIKKELKEHYEATNPHHVTPEQIGLGNVENTSDIDKPISRLTQTALDLKLDKSAIPANAKFTDTTYEIKDGELSEYNFNKSYKDKLDYLSTNRQLLSAGNALRAQGRNIILTRADGSTETIETQDTIYDDTNVLQTLSNILTKFDALNIKDNLNSENGVLSAKQGKILNDKITEIKEMLKSDNVDLDSLQEIVTFIENNKHLIDSLEIDNIANLRNVLNSKCDFVNEQGTVRNALNFDNHEISDFVMKRDYLNYKNNIDNSIATINTKFSNYYTKSETDSKIQLAVDSIDYSGINRKIDNNFNTLNDKISAIDYTYIATDLQNAKTQLEAKDLEIQTDLTNKYSELKTTINSINFAQINSDIANLNKLIKDNSLGDLNTNVTNNKAKIDEILNNLQLYLKKSEFTDEINKEYAQNIEPKINEKISRLVTQNDLLNKATELNTLITKLQEKLNSTNSDLNDVEDDISNIYHLLHNVKVDLSSYYTKAEVDAKIKNADLSLYAKTESVYDKNQIDNKLNDYVSKGLLLKYFDLNKSGEYSFPYEYILKRKEKNILDIKLPRYIENYDLINNFVFFKLFSKYYKYGSRIFNGSNLIILDGKQFQSIVGENTSSGVIFPYGEEFFESKKYTEYLYALLVAKNTEITKQEGEEYKLKYYHKKIVRVKIEQTNVFNENDNTVTIRIELKNLEEYTKDYNYPEDEQVTYYNENFQIDFKGLDKRAFRKIEEDPDFSINIYGDYYNNDAYFVVVPNDVKEIFENNSKLDEKGQSDNTLIFEKCFKLNLDNPTGLKNFSVFFKETTLVEDENNAKLGDILKKYKYPNNCEIDEDCLEITTTSNFNANYEIIKKEISTDLFTFKIQNKNDNTIRILKIYDYSFHKFTLDNNQHLHQPTFEANYKISVTNPIKYEDFNYMFHFIDTNSENYNSVNGTFSKLKYDEDLYPKVVIKSIYVGRYIAKETEKESKIKSLIDSKIAAIPTFNVSQYYNKDEIDNNFVTKEKIHDDYYAKSETEQKISKKATEIDSKITEIKSQLTDYYRQSETYSKAEVDTKIKEMKDNKNHDFDDIYTKYDLLPLEIIENSDVKKHPKIKRLNSNEEDITDNYGHNSRTIESCPEVLAQQDIRITNSAFPEQFLNDPLVFWNKDIKSKESNTQFILNDKDNIYIKFYKDIRLTESEYNAEYFKNNVFLLNDQRCRKLNFVFYINDTLSVICDSYFATVQEVSGKKYKISYESEGFKYDATSQELEFYIDLNNIEVINNEGENTFYLKIKNSPENKTLERKYLFFPLPDLYIDSKDNSDYETIKNELDTYTSKLQRKQNNMNHYVPMTMIYDRTDGETETTNKNITSDRTKLTDITFALNPLENDFDYRDESIIYKVLNVNLGLYFDNDNTKLLNYFKTNFNITTFGYTTLMLEDSYLCLNLKSVDNNNYGFGRKFKGNVTLDSKVFTFEFDYGITIKQNLESKLDFPYKDYKYTSVYFDLQSPIKISGNGITKTLKIRDVVDLGFQIPYSSTLTDTNYLGICMYGDFRMNDIWLKYNFFLRNNDITQSMSLHPNQYIKYQEKTFSDKLSEKAINVDNVIVKSDLTSFSPNNISSTIRTNIHDGAGILLPSENWKSVQNFQTVSDTRDFQIFVNYENPKSGVLVNDEKRCVSGVILIDVRHDNGLETTTMSGQEIIKINDFDKTSFKRGINIISYFCVEKTIYITKVK